ncbi:MAG TPA: UDP-3-O-(3-hydroxymyristoyl)glucosamine N-acyltransferase [Deltaproteobacteria bacterium]|nr:UDP-3-O-(3-hydroxymyristoyl)glucosamine N-acyltransferase [Deltaproteobacteria bacterium]
MKIALKEIARILGGELRGHENVVICDVNSIEEAGEGEITFVAGKKYVKKLHETKASAVIVPAQLEAPGKNLVIVPDPYVAFAKLLALFHPQQHAQKGVSPDAYIDEGAIVSPEANIFPRAFISRGAKIEKGAVIYPGVFIGQDVCVGENSVLYANVTVYHSCVIAKRVILHSGVVIGADGLGFANPGKENNKIPQVGFVQIDDDAEIGANSTVDRATMGKTWIKRNVKIDNLVQVAHNVVIGENSVLAAMVGISGSTRLGNGVIVGGQTGMVDHINIGDNVMIGAGSKIHKDIPAGQIVGGRPQMPYKLWLRSEACQSRLPEMRASIEMLLEKVQQLEKTINIKNGKG